MFHRLKDGQAGEDNDQSEVTNRGDEPLLSSHVPKIQLPSALDRRAYRLKEVTEMIGIPTSTLRSMIRRGDLNPITGFRTWLISTDELERVMAQRLR